MGYYNFMYIFKNILYNIKSCFKYFVIALCLILVILFILTISKVSAETYSTGFTQNEINLLESCWNDYKDQFDTYTCFKDSNDYILINVFNRPDNFIVRRNNGINYFTSNLPVIGTGHWIKIFLSDGHREVNNFTGNTTNYSVWQNGAYPLWGNIPIYEATIVNGIQNDGNVILWAPANYGLIPPSIENFKNQNVINSMIARRIF